MKLTDFDAVLFDKDGTIFDSEKVCCDGWIHAAKQFNVEFTAQMYKTFIGVPTPDCLKMAQEQFGPGVDMVKYAECVSNYMLEQKKIGLPIKKGFDRFFRYLVSQNMPLGLVTSSNTKSVKQSFAPTPYKQHLDVIVTFDDIDHPKPAPDCYLLACNQLGVEPAKTLVFEDSNAGVEAALSAGCQTVLIPDLVDITPALQEACLYTFKDFDEAYEQLTA